MTNGDLPQAEFDVMDVLWRKKEATVKEVLSSLRRERNLAYTTVATLLTRLRDKDYVSAEERNFAYVYRPIVGRDQVVRRKVKDLVERVLGGELGPLAAYMAENGKLTPEQIEALEQIVRSSASEDES